MPVHAWLRSVLEPGRTLTLAEKGGAGAELIRAAPGFRIFATMNPGAQMVDMQLLGSAGKRHAECAGRVPCCFVLQSGSQTR